MSPLTASCRHPTRLAPFLLAAGLAGLQAPSVRSAEEGTRRPPNLDAERAAFRGIRRIAVPAVKVRPGAHAVVVVGLGADAAQSARMHEEAENAHDAFIVRGIPTGSIIVIEPDAGGTVRREAVLSALRSLPPPVDETWLMLIGQVANGRDGSPAFQVSGPRLSAQDLARAIAALPGQKFVMVATTLGGGFLPPLLALPQVEAASATADSGELSEPRFTPAWLELLQEKPAAGFRELAIEASGRVEAFCKEHNLALGEHAQLIDRLSAKIISAPFPPPAPSGVPAPNP